MSGSPMTPSAPDFGARGGGAPALGDRPATGADAAPLLDVRGLSLTIAGKTASQLIRDVSFSLRAGERVGIVGESGCGKTVTGLSLMRLHAASQIRPSGEVRFQGRDLLGLSEREMRAVRGRDIAIIFQEPMSALDPVFTVGEQISEAYRAHFPASRKEGRERAIEALASVGIPAPERRCDDYPHQLSGGMRQRVMIAMALICRPQLLIADEPTTALDVTVQAQITDLLSDMSERLGTALLFITHDLGVVAETCNRVITMYAGEVVEDAPVDEVLIAPRHPYTSGLMRSLPGLSPRRSKLPSIPGRIPSLIDMPRGCRFEPRCAYSASQCLQPQPMTQAEPNHRARCGRSGELSLSGVTAR
jgi:peptide/nickel transport system ATP-binding protein